jgi:hypothetical protein
VAQGKGPEFEPQFLRNKEIQFPGALFAVQGENRTEGLKREEKQSERP